MPHLTPKATESDEDYEKVLAAAADETHYFGEAAHNPPDLSGMAENDKPKTVGAPEESDGPSVKVVAAPEQEKPAARTRASRK